MNNPALTNQTEQVPDAQLDLRGTPCPINFVRTKLRLQQMTPGSLLEVWLDPGEPIEQVPDSLVMEGYELEKIEDRTEFFALRVRRPDGGTTGQGHKGTRAQGTF
ncbi:MAG: sulfurtransferase TusA family protein [Xenococcaceae cyanobacterium]